MTIAISQVLHIIKIVLQMIAVQCKEKKNILIYLILVNLFASFGYLLLTAYTGLLTCGIAVVQTVIQYFYDKKKKKVPKSFAYIYILTSIIGGIFMYKSIIDILPILSFVMYTLSIMQKDTKHVRIYTLLKLLLWIPYDGLKLAIASMIGRIITIISTIIGMIRLDRKKVNRSIKLLNSAKELNTNVYNNGGTVI